MRRIIGAACIVAGLLMAPGVVWSQTGSSQDRAFDSAASVYVPRATQCVLFDTRPTQGGSGAIAANAVRTFGLTGDLSTQGGDAGCAVHTTADGYHLNVVAIGPAGAGNLKAWPASSAEPNGGIVNYSAASTMNNSNAFHVPNDSGGLKVKANGAGVHVRGVLYGTLRDGGEFYAPEGLEAEVAALTAEVAALTATVGNDAWAKVSANAGGAALLSGDGAVSVTRIFTGQFQVTFGPAITGCGWLATLNDNDAGVAPPGEISIERDSAADPFTLRVRTFNSSGTPADPSSGDGFTVQVDC